MKVYIAGPITGMPNENREAFSEAEDIIISKGHFPVSPIKVCKNIEKGSLWEAYMKCCIPALLGCDAIFMLDGWAQSRGAKIESDLAEKLGIERFSVGSVK